MQRLSLPLALLAATLLGAGCQEPCVALAERICNCEPDQISRQQCRNDRIEAQQGRTATDAEQEACLAALDTCTCEALEENRVDLCAFTRDDGATALPDAGS